MFENLTDKLQVTFKKLRGQGKLSEKNMDEGLREVRMSLLEADVNFRVVKDFIKRVKQEAVGRHVFDSVSPSQQIIKIVHDQLVELMGTKAEGLKLSSTPPTVIMLVGLQGAGKTTLAGKLASHLVKTGRRPMLVGADIYRPAGIKQLQVLSESLSLPFFSLGPLADPVDICKKGAAEAAKESRDIVILDTAGRLHIDDKLMGELCRIRDAVKPNEILLVADAMTGQDAVAAAEGFYKALDITGVVLTKLDGDARGGAALSIRAVTGCPIKFVSVGEKLDSLEVFHPERLASRILGMGDVVTLVEKAQEVFDEKKAVEWEDKLRKSQFTLEDFLDNLRQMKKMGSMQDLMGMIPGMGSMKNMQVDEGELARVEAMISSMTLQERRHPKIINGSRRKRVAKGSGNRVQDVNRMLKQFGQAQKMMKQLTKKKGALSMLGGRLPF
ncbi:signal recognition particle protein [Candidatus Hydrogenedentota bacterium]